MYELVLFNPLHFVYEATETQRLSNLLAVGQCRSREGPAPGLSDHEPVLHFSLFVRLLLIVEDVKMLER